MNEYFGRQYLTSCIVFLILFMLNFSESLIFFFISWDDKVTRTICKMITYNSISSSWNHGAYSSLLFTIVLSKRLSVCPFGQEWLPPFLFLLPASPRWDTIQRALGLHPTPIIPAETAQVPRPSRTRPRQGKFHIRDICRCFAWPPLQLTFKAGTACPAWLAEPRGISNSVHRRYPLAFFRVAIRSNRNKKISKYTHFRKAWSNSERVPKV